MHRLILAAGGVEIVIGGAVTAWPALVPQWVGFAVIGLGLVTIAYAVWPVFAGRNVLLNDAVMDAWEQIRKLPEFDKPPPRLPFDSLREYYEADPVKMPGIVAQVIFTAANPPIPIKGISPPRTVMEVIPKDIAGGYAFSDDATEMFDTFDREKPAEQRR